MISVSGLDAGNYTLSVTTIADYNHNNVTKTAKFNVNKIKSDISIPEIILDYGESRDVAITAVGAVNITAEIDGKGIGVNGFIIPISNLNATNYTLSVTNVPDDNHISVTKTAIIIVNKVNSSLTVNNVEIGYDESVNVDVATEELWPFLPKSIMKMLVLMVLQFRFQV